MTLVVLAGLGVGLGLIGIRAGLRPRRRPAAALLHSLESAASGRVAGNGHAPSPSADGGRDTGDSDRRPATDPVRLAAAAAGAYLVSALEQRATVPAALRTAARTAQRPLESLVAESVLAGVVGAALPPAVTVAMQAAGVHIAVALAAWSSLTLAVSGALLPFALLRGETRRTRQQARTVVATYLDLVVLCLAGGMGIESALHGAAGIADDPVSKRLAAVLGRAQDAGEAPWVALSTLGDELDVAELEELAAAVRLAGTEGARIRPALAAKAASIRRRELADAEAEANGVTERLFLPGALLLVGFLLFLGFPAVARITAGL